MSEDYDRGYAAGVRDTWRAAAEHLRRVADRGVRPNDETAELLRDIARLIFDKRGEGG